MGFWDAILGEVGNAIKLDECSIAQFISRAFRIYEVPATSATPLAIARKKPRTLSPAKSKTPSNNFYFASEIRTAARVRATHCLLTSAGGTPPASSATQRRRKRRAVS